MLASVVTGSGMILAHVDVVRAAPVAPAEPSTTTTVVVTAEATSATNTTSSASDATTSTATEPTVPVGPTTIVAPTTTATTEVAVGEVGTGMAPVPDAMSGAAVAQGGPVLAAMEIDSSSSVPALPTTGQQVDLTITSGVGLAIFGAALLRLRRRPRID